MYQAFKWIYTAVCTTFDTKLRYWRVARQRYTAVAQLGFKRRAKVEHSSSTASETGVKQLE